MRGRSSAGFTIVEFLIVFGVCVICAWIALPNFYAARIRVNEKATVNHLSTLFAANTFYLKQYHMYPQEMRLLQHGDFLSDPTLAQASLHVKKDGYNYIYLTQPPYHNYLIFALPETYSSTGFTSFVVNEQGRVFEADLGETQTANKIHFTQHDFFDPRKPLWKIEDRQLRLSDESVWTPSKIASDQ